MSNENFPTKPAVFSAVPLVQRDPPSSDEEDSSSINSLLSLQSHDSDFITTESLQETCDSSGFIFGLRSGFATQIFMGLLVFLYFDQDVHSLLEKPTNIGILTVFWSIFTVFLAVLSSRFFRWIHSSQSDQQSLEEEYHLFHGSLIGMYMAWVIFDLFLSMGLIMLFFHSAVAYLGHSFLQRAKNRFIHRSSLT